MTLGTYIRIPVRLAYVAYIYRCCVHIFSLYTSFDVAYIYFPLHLFCRHAIRLKEGGEEGGVQRRYTFVYLYASHMLRIYTDVA